VPDDLREDAEAMAYFDRTFEELASAVEHACESGALTP
jgi:hypothetical protein